MAAARRPSHDELRQSGRSRVVGFAWFQVLGESEGGLARSCDLSSSGLGLVTSRAIEPGLRVFLKLMHRGRSVSVVGNVMHCRQEGALYRVGLQLEVVAPDDRTTIDWILQT